MSKKICLVGDNTEIKIGDKITLTREIGASKFAFSSVIDEDIMKQLISEGIAIEIDDTPEVDMLEINDRLSKKLHTSMSSTNAFIGSIMQLNPSAGLNIILREIALKLDEKYPDHISNAKEIYILSLLDGRLHKINCGQIKNYRNFAAFRTEEDARTACRAVRHILKVMFNDK